MENEEKVDTETTENNSEGGDTESVEKVERPKLTDDEQLAIYKRKTKQLEKRLGIYEEPKESKSKEKKSDEFGLTEITFLRAEGIRDAEEVELVKKAYKEAGLKPDQLPELLSKRYLKEDLENLRTTRANAEATSDLKGSSGGDSEVKQTPEYWIKKGELPEKTPANMKLLAKIGDALIAQQKSGKMFYND